MARRRQRGYLLVTVIVTLFLIASIAVLLAHDSAISANTASKELETARADYVARAGMQHALWRAQNNACLGNVTIPDTALGADSYNATITGAAAGSLITVSADQDAWIRSDDVTMNNGKTAWNHVRNETLGTEQALTRFDVSSIAAKAQISSAVAWFHLKALKPHPEGSITIHEITADWTETGITWESFGGAYRSSVIGMIPAQDAGDVWVAVNLTAQVQAWVNGQPNYGILFEPTTDGTHTEYTAREDGTNPPRLEVVVGSGEASPVTIKAKGELESGVRRESKDKLALAYQPPGQIAFQPDAADGVDAYIWEANKTTNYGSDDETWASQSTNNTSLSLFKFDIERIPAGSQILTAVLSLHHRSGNNSNVPITAHRITESWDEDAVTWNERKSGVAWSDAGGDIDPTIIATTNVGPENFDRHEWDIAPLVQNWVDGKYTNDGVALATKMAGSIGERFDSSDHTDPARRPKLTITYACECGSTCLGPQGSGNVLMVIGSSPFNPSASDDYLRDRFEAWGYQVTFIQDDDSQGNFDAAIASSDAVFVSESVSTGNVGAKLQFATIGVVNQEGSENDEFGLAAGMTSHVADQINVSNTSHFITSIFQPGTVTIYDRSMELLTASGNEAAEQLADFGGAGALIAAEAGTPLVSIGNAAGRRVMVPIGNDSNVNLTFVNNNGWLLLQRSLAWAMNADGGSSGDLLMVVGNDSSLTSQEIAKKALVQSWGFSVSVIDEDKNQTEFDAAFAVNDVVFVTEDVNAADVNTKLTGATIGVVSEEANLADDLGLAQGIGWGSGVEIGISDNLHYITAGFSIGPLQVLNTSESLYYLTPNLAPDLQDLGRYVTQVSLTSIDVGGSLEGGGTAAGRRVMLPWGGNNMDVNYLTTDGLTIFQRALEWGAGAEGEFGPIAHWKLDETSGTTAVDSEGGHDGTLTNGPVWANGTVGGSLEFDGVDDAINAGAAEALQDIFDGGGTLTAWMRPAGWGEGNYGRIADKSSATYPGNGWALELYGANASFLFQTGFSIATGSWITPNGSVSLDKWQHVALVYDSSSDANVPVIFIDGIAQVITELDTPSGALRSDAGIDLTIGNHAMSAVRTFDGALDEVRIYNRMLAAAEIAELATPTVPLLLVVDDASSLSSKESAAKALMESWGYAVTTINANASQSNFNTALAAVDVAYISGTISSAELGAKLKAATVGVVSEDAGTMDDMGVAEPVLVKRNAQFIDIVDNTHYVTSGLSIGSLAIVSSSIDIWTASGALASGLQVLGETLVSGTGYPPGVATMETGATLYGGGSAAGRRVQVPWSQGSSTFDLSMLTADGLNIMQRAIEWGVGTGGGGGGGGGGGSCSGTFRDEFNAKTFSGNDGALSWAGDWSEVGESDGPTGGDTKVTNDESDYQLQIKDNDNGGEGVERVADLSGGTTATLSLDYRRQSLDNANDYVALSISSTGTSGPWTELDRYQGGATDSDYQSVSYDIGSYMSATTAIRLRSSPNNGGSDKVFFDNVEIQCTP